MLGRTRNTRCWMLTTALGSTLIALVSGGGAAADDTATPIKHVIILIGENRSFDNIYGMYRPRDGQSVSNLLSKGIVNSSGGTVLNTQATQYKINLPLASPTYFINSQATPGKTPYQTLPLPNTAYAPKIPTTPADWISTSNPQIAQAPFDKATVPDSLLPTIEPSFEQEDLGLLRLGATGLDMFSTDTRVTNYNNLPNGVFQLTGPTLPYYSFTGDMVHRLFHMWQQSDCSTANVTPNNPSGCLSDLYPFVGVARNDGSGGNSMAFYNVQKGDAPVFKRLADEYTLNDNYHQPVMGGTAVQHIMIGAADAIPWDTFIPPGSNTPITAPPGHIADPTPLSTTNVAFTADGQWTNCSDPKNQPGIAPIVSYLATLPWHPKPNCAPGSYYMINNLSPGTLPNGTVDAAAIETGGKVPPSSLRTIGDALNEKGISWAYYGGGFNAAVRVANGSTDPVDQLLTVNYCDICNVFSYTKSIMGDPAQRSAHIKDAIDFFSTLDQGKLPSVAYVKPDSIVDGHPASSTLDLFEAMLENIVGKLKSHPDLLKETALFVTFDEGHGYWDSGFIQPLDFFGDGPRIPMLVISPYSRGGKIVHSYNGTPPWRDDGRAAKGPKRARAYATAPEPFTSRSLWENELECN
jgi:phospholipase C